MRSSSIEFNQGLALLAVGVVGALAARAIGMPAGMMVGALLTSGLYRLAGGNPGPWRGRYSRVGRLLLGTVIGAAFGPDVLAPLRATLLPMMALTVVIVAVGLGLGWALGRFTALDAKTALISGIPGGMPAMVAIAEDAGADAAVTAAIHFSRLTTILVVTPTLIPLLAAAPARTGAAPLNEVEVVGLWVTLAALACGLVGGTLALYKGLPVGDLVGSILAVGALNLMGAGLGPLDGNLRCAAMLLIGVSVGAQTSRQSLRQLRQIMLPVAIFVALIISAGLLLGWVLSQVTPLDLPTALLSSVPGGASTMPAITHDLGGDMRLVAALHLTRQLSVFIFLPFLLNHLLYSRKQLANSYLPICKIFKEKE